MKYAQLFALVVAGLGFPLVAFGADEDVTVLIHKEGVAHGIILKETDKEVLIRTFVGDKTFAKHEIIEIRKNLTATERAEILRKVNPGQDLADWKARNEALTAQGGTEKGDTPKVITPPEVVRVARRPDAPQDPVGGSGSLQPTPSFAGRQAPWQERMSAGLDRRVTFEFIDEPLVSAVEMISTLTGVNIIVQPKVRELNPKLTLNVKNMDAANALKWITKLTETHLSVQEQALYLTAEASKEHVDEERDELLMAVTRAGVDPSVLPAEGTEITESDRMKVALAIFEKETPKPTDFPGPLVGASSGDSASHGAGNPFVP